MNTAGLSLSDAPPFRAVYPFFIAAACFGALSFLALSFASGPDRYDGYIIASLHLFTIGFLLNTIFGALLQMLPVVGGIKIESPKIIKISLIGISLGAALFFAGFSLYHPFLTISAAILPITLLLGIGMILFKIFSNNGVVSVTIKGVRFALVAAVIVIALGAHLLGSHAAGHIGASHLKFANIHIMLSIFGFVGALIISVSHQVLPMFYVAPDFPKLCRYQPVIIFTATLLLFIPSQSVYIAAQVVIWMAFLAFAIVSLKRLNKRRRLLSDASLKLWQTGFISLLIALLLWAYDAFFDLAHRDLLFALFFGIGFAGSIVKAMINKIVPFLAWFHLTSQGKWNAPSVREMITDKNANIELYLHLASIFLFVSSLLFAPLFVLASLTACASFAVLLANIVRAVKIYEKELLNISK